MFHPNLLRACRRRLPDLLVLIVSWLACGPMLHAQPATGTLEGSVGEFLRTPAYARTVRHFGFSSLWTFGIKGKF